MRPHQSLSDVISAFLANQVDVVSVVDESDRLIGIVSKYAVYRSLLQNMKLDEPIYNLIRPDVVTLHADDPLERAKDVLIDHQVGHGIVVDENSRVLGVMGKSHMIQGFLKNREQWLQQLIGLTENLQDAVVAVDDAENITTFNRAAERMFKVRQETVLGQSIAIQFPGLSQRLHHTLSTGQRLGPERIEIGHCIAMGSFIPFSHSSAASGAMAVLRDITAIESIARELETTKNLEQMLQHAIALSYDGILVLDPNGCVTLVNDAALDVLGRQRQVLVGRRWADIVSEFASKIPGANPSAQILAVYGRPCLVTQEPMMRNGLPLGSIVKVIFHQLDEWRDVFHHLERLESNLSFYRGELHRTQSSDSAFDRIISVSNRIDTLKQQAALAAPGTSTVLITGESGTGKELFAEAIHEESGRKGKLIKVNCAAIPEELLESEFFGYADGAYTGARRGGKPGKFELADKGTIFLDEIGDMPLSLQAKLLRILQEQSFERLGGTSTIRVDVRIIAATHRELQKMIVSGEFREDLYYRINVVHLAIPPLRERTEDIPQLCEHLLKKLNQKLHKSVMGITSGAMTVLQRHVWPGNVRQLENVLERAMNLGIDDWIEQRHLPAELRDAPMDAPCHHALSRQNLSTQSERSGFDTSERAESNLGIFEPSQRTSNRSSGENGSYKASLESVEKQYLLDALRRAGGNRTKAAELLGISRSALYQKLRKHQVRQEISFD